MKKKLILIIITLCIVCIIVVLFLSKILFNFTKEIKGIDNYNKSYYIKEYGGDIDSNLSIFPDDTSKMIEPTFSSSFSEGLFDTDGYILLSTKYNKEDFDSEVKRLSTLEMTISNCNNSYYTNYVMFDNTSYKYPSYITIDGFDSTYEYALINEKDFEIKYIYISYPDINNDNYKEYLKNDKNEYLNTNTIDKYSMYNHSFDNGESFSEFDDCK